MATVPNRRIDYYNGTGFHFYGLLYSQWEAERDPERAGAIPCPRGALCGVFCAMV